MQAVVDHRGLFLDIYLGWPGKVHDARVLVNSDIYRLAMAGSLFPSQTKCIGGTNIPLMILGDPAYPLLPWLMKPYPEHIGMDISKRHFNYRLSHARIVVENAFGRLKGRWRCLLKRNDSHLENIPNIVAACVCLHNICEITGDLCEHDWVSPSSSSDNSTGLDNGEIFTANRDIAE